MDITVIKRDGRKEKFKFDKIEQHIERAVAGLNVDKEQVLNNFKIRLKPVMYSSDIQKSLIYAAADLIDEYNEDMQYVAARLLLQDIYKSIYGEYKPKFSAKIIRDRVEKGIYDSIIFDYYS
jgi:ribonucleoside-diphosphate reductase alpha chain